MTKTEAKNSTICAYLQRCKFLLVTAAIAAFGLITPVIGVFSFTRGRANAVTSSTLNFQARLLSSSGSPVADGTYNIEFNLYTVSSGGSTVWTEDYLNTGTPVTVKDGFLSVNLGSLSSFPGTINWDQEHWLGMTVRGTGSCAFGSCTPADSEMTPRFKLTAVPYAFQAGNALGVSSNATSTASTNSNNVTVQSGNASGATSNSGNVTIDAGTATGTAGQLLLGTANASVLTLGRTGLTTTNSGGLSVGQDLSVSGNTTHTGDLTVNGNTYVGNATTDRLTITAQLLGASPLVFQGATDNSFTTTFTITDPTANNTITFPDASGTVQLAPTSGGYLFQIPVSTAANTITPTANSVTSLTVNGTSGTAATAVNILQGGAASGLDITSSSTGNGQNISLTNTSGTQTSGLAITRNGAGGTTTSLIDLTNTAGTVTNGLNFTGTYTNLINAPNFSVTNAGAITGVGVNSGTGLIQGTGGVTVTGADANVNVSSNFNTNINTGTSSGTVTIGNSASTIALLGATNINTSGTATTTIGNATGAVALQGTTTLSAGFSQTGANTFSTGTGAVSLNGDTTIASGKTLTVAGTGATTLGGTLSVTGTQTFTGLGTFNGGLTVATGSTLTNASSTLLTALAVSDVAGGGNIGTAAATVDVATTFNVNQTTASQTLTLPSPTTTTGGRIAYVNNVGSVSFTMGGITLAAGGSQSYIWNGTAWVVTSTNIAVTTVGAIDSQTKAANGAVISGTTIYLQTADATNVGLVSTGTQTLAGAKTFSSLVTGSAGLTVTGADINLNASSNFNTNINTGTSTGAVSIGNNTGNTAITIDSGTGAINIGTGAQARSVNIGTGAAAQTVTLGSATSTSTTTINAGTGGLSVGDAGVANTIQIGNTSGAVAQTINIGNNATGSSTSTVVLGSTVGTSGVTIQAGSNNINLNAGTIATNQTTVNLLNTTATTVNAFGAATTLSLGATTGTTTVNNSLTVGGSAGNGSIFINNGATRNTALAISNLATGGTIGSAATTVDLYTYITVNQTTAGQSITAPAPTTATAGKVLYVSNIGSASFTFTPSGGTAVTLTAGSTQSLLWNGSAWTSTGIDTGVTIVGTIDSQTKAANGAVISGNTIYLQNADATNVGLVSTTTQTLAGVKTFSSGVTIGTSAGSGLFTNNGATLNTTLALTNIAGGGAIGTAAATVDIYTSISVAQTTASQTLTIPTPTANTSYGRMLYLSNVGTTSFTLGGVVINTGTTATLIWSNTNGAASWQFAGADGNGILNQNSSDQTANFRISGTGRANTSFTTPLVDSITGALSVGTSTATGVTIGSATNNSSITIDSGTGAISIGTGSQARTTSIATGAAAQTVTIGSTNTTSALTLAAGTGAITFNATQAQFSEVTGTRTLTVQTRTGSNVAGSSLTVQAGTAAASGAAAAGGTLTLQGGSANGATGSANGGNVVISGGTGFGASGLKGLVVIDTPTFSTATSQNCATADCTITQANVDSYGAVIVTFSSTGYEAAMPDPNQTTAGRIVYVTAANGTSDFTLCLNDVAANGTYDGTCNTTTGNSIAMRANTTATLVWNGSDWTAAGASSSTDLQAAYNNTLTSAGGAELVLNASGGAADGLTVRNNATSPIIGGIFEAQTSTGSNIFSVNNNSTEYAVNGGAETSSGFSTNWLSAPAGGTVARNTSSPTSTVATGQASVSVVTTATASHGARNLLSGALTYNLKYNVSYTVRADSASSSFTSLETMYSSDGSATAGNVRACVSGTPTYFTGTASQSGTTITGSGTTWTSTMVGQIFVFANGASALITGYTSATSLSTSASYSQTVSSQNYNMYNAGNTVNVGTWSRVSCTFIAPASGTLTNNSIFIRQTDATARTFYIDNLSVTISADVNHAVDGSVDDSTNFATNWTAAPGGGTVTRTTSTLYDTSASAQVVTTATAGHGLRNNMSITPSVSTQYLVTFYAKSSNTFSDIRVRYTRDGGTNFASCTDYNTQSISTTAFTKVTCLFTTDSTTATNPDLVIDQTTGTARTFYVDALSVTLNTNNSNNVQIGAGSKGGPVTLFTLDRSGSAPIAANNDAYLGSMYYDTTTGRIQCYEADGWGACGSAPDNYVNLNPEYSGAVLNGSGVGTMTADFCANQSGVLQVNTSLCSTGESRNFYKWTSPQASDQTYSIYVSYQLPATFKSFSSDDTVQLTARTDSTTNGSVTYEMFKSESGALTACGTATTVTSVVDTWQTVGINGNESTSCSFTTSSANAFVIFKINVTAKSNANVYVGTLSFTTTGR